MNKHIDNIIKSIGRHKKGLRDPQIMHPEREWGIGMFLAVLVFVFSGTWSLALYIENRNVSVEIPLEEQSESIVYRESMVEEALARLEERATTLTSLLPREVETTVVEEVVEEVATSSEATTPLLEEVNEVEEGDVTEDLPIVIE